MLRVGALLLVVWASLAWPLSATAEERRVALVLGMQGYGVGLAPSPRFMPALKNAKADAARAESILKANRYEVFPGHDLTRSGSGSV